MAAKSVGKNWNTYYFLVYTIHNVLTQLDPKE